MTAIRRKTSGVAMVLAAGKGVRMRPLTNRRPKPMVEVAGRSLIDRAFDRLAEAGMTRAVVNLHHHAALLQKHVQKRRDIEVRFSDEGKLLLETGGGVKKALTHLSGKGPRPRPFFAVNADALWLDGRQSTLARLAEAWDGRRMDALLLLMPTSRAMGYQGSGDYRRSKEGRLTRLAGKPAPYVFAGVQILHPRLFKTAPRGLFSLVRLYDEAEAKGRLFGLAHDGAWMHVGTPASVDQAARELKRLGRT